MQGHGGYDQQGYGGYNHQQGYIGSGQHQLPSMPSSGGAGILPLPPGKGSNKTKQSFSPGLAAILNPFGNFRQFGHVWTSLD